MSRLVKAKKREEEEAARKAKEKLDKVTAEEKAREKKKWSGVLKQDTSDSHLYDDDLLYGKGENVNSSNTNDNPPSPPQLESAKIPQGNASSAVQFLRSASTEEDTSNKQSKVVSIGLDL